MDWSRHSVLVGKGICVVVMGLLASGFASAYPTPVDFSGKLERWPINRDAPKITWEVFSNDDASTAGYKELVRESATIWSNVHGSYAELEAADAKTAAMISIHFDTNIVGGDSSAGYAEFDSSDQHGPLHCSIHIAAPANVDWAGLAKTTLHEIGHCLGLGHSVVPESIMSYRLDKNDFALALDDEAAVSRLYPLDGSSPRKPAGCVLGRPQSGSFKSLLFFLILIPVSLRLMRRHLG